MKKLVFALSLLLAFALGAQAQEKGKVVTDSLRAVQLDGRFQKYNVYLPHGYDKTKSYPVVYLLHGLTGNYKDWTRQGHMKEVVDEFIRSGEICPMVIIMPNAGDKDVHHYQNGYFNVAGWPFEDYFFGTFLPEVEKKYNCGGSKGKRAIMGLSMGGGGTVVDAQRQPELFSSAYAMSAWLDNQDHSKRGSEVPGSKLAITDQSVRDHSAIDFLDNATPATLESLRSIKWFVDCGDDDFLFNVNILFFQKMKAKGIPCELRIRDGIHNWEYWHTALRTSLPFASRNFEK